MAAGAVGACFSAAPVDGLRGWRLGDVGLGDAPPYGGLNPGFCAPCSHLYTYLVVAGLVAISRPS